MVITLIFWTQWEKSIYISIYLLKNLSFPSRLARRRKTMKLCRDLSDLVVYTNSVAAQDIIDDGKVV